MENYNPTLLSKKQILTGTTIALVVGMLLLVSAVLPAEYGIDPLGTGKALGFSRLYHANETARTTKIGAGTTEASPLLAIKDLGSDPEVPRPKEAQNPPPVQQYGERRDSVLVMVAAGKGIEYKVKVLKYGTLKYDWTTDQGILYSDFHGDVKELTPPKEEFYVSYTVAYSNNVAGTFLAPYEGRHGWYFKNKSDRDITVTLRLSGQYILD